MGGASLRVDSKIDKLWVITPRTSNGSTTNYPNQTSKNITVTKNIKDLNGWQNNNQHEKIYTKQNKWKSIHKWTINVPSVRTPTLICHYLIFLQLKLPLLGFFNNCQHHIFQKKILLWHFVKEARNKIFCLEICYGWSVVVWHDICYKKAVVKFCTQFAWAFHGNMYTWPSKNFPHGFRFPTTNSGKLFWIGNISYGWRTRYKTRAKSNLVTRFLPWSWDLSWQKAIFS